MRKLILIFTLLLIGVSTSDAQTNLKPCSTPEFSQFDFWVGQWELTWSDSLHGSNIITKSYNDCVIQEKFDGNPGAKFNGMSLTTYNVRTQK